MDGGGSLLNPLIGGILFCRQNAWFIWPERRSTAAHKPNRQRIQLERFYCFQTMLQGLLKYFSNAFLNKQKVLPEIPQGYERHLLLAEHKITSEPAESKEEVLFTDLVYIAYLSPSLFPAVRYSSSVVHGNATLRDHDFSCLQLRL